MGPKLYVNEGPRQRAPGWAEVGCTEGPSGAIKTMLHRSIRLEEDYSQPADMHYPVRLPIASFFLSGVYKAGIMQTHHEALNAECGLHWTVYQCTLPFWLFWDP